MDESVNDFIKSVPKMFSFNLPLNNESFHRFLVANNMPENFLYPYLDSSQNFSIIFRSFKMKIIISPRLMEELSSAQHFQGNMNKLFVGHEVSYFTFQIRMKIGKN